MILKMLVRLLIVGTAVTLALAVAQNAVEITHAPSPATPTPSLARFVCEYENTVVFNQAFTRIEVSPETGGWRVWIGEQWVDVERQATCTVKPYAP